MWNAEKRVVIKQVKGVSKVTFEVYARLPNGRVVRQRYNDEAEAITFAEDLKAQGRNILKAKALNQRPSAITDTQEADYLTAMGILEKKFGSGWTVSKAATWVATNYFEQAWDETEVHDACLQHLE